MLFLELSCSSLPGHERGLSDNPPLPLASLWFQVCPIYICGTIPTELPLFLSDSNLLFKVIKNVC